MKTKEDLVRRSAFPKPSLSLDSEPTIVPGIAHKKVTKVKVAYALISQSAIKAPRPDKINFQIFHIIWDWDKIQITNLVQKVIRLGYYPKQWKKSCGILLEKGGKQDLGLVRLYQVISLLNRLDKVVKKVVAQQFALYCEAYSKLHPGQMSA